MVRKIGAFIEVRTKFNPPQVEYVRASSIDSVAPKYFTNILISTNPRNGQTKNIHGCTIRWGPWIIDCYESLEEVLAACNSILALEIMADEGALA